MVMVCFGEKDSDKIFLLGKDLMQDFRQFQRILGNHQRQLFFQLIGKQALTTFRSKTEWFP